MRLLEIKPGRWAVYDKSGRVVIITTSKRIAEVLHERVNT